MVNKNVIRKLIHFKSSNVIGKLSFSELRYIRNKKRAKKCLFRSVKNKNFNLKNDDGN